MGSEAGTAVALCGCHDILFIPWAGTLSLEKKKKKKEKRSTGHKSSSTIISSFPVSMSIIDLASRFPGEAERRDSALLVHGHLTVFNPSTFIVSNGGGRPFAPTSK